jgi:hypothetical protein
MAMSCITLAIWVNSWLPYWKTFSAIWTNRLLLGRCWLIGISQMPQWAGRRSPHWLELSEKFRISIQYSYLRSKVVLLPNVYCCHVMMIQFHRAPASHRRKHSQNFPESVRKWMNFCTLCRTFHTFLGGHWILSRTVWMCPTFLFPVKYIYNTTINHVYFTAIYLD